MRRWPRVGQVLPGGKGVSCGPWGVNLQGGSWGVASGVRCRDMNFDVGDSGKLGAAQDSSQHLLGSREGV